MGNGGCSFVCGRYLTLGDCYSAIGEAAPNDANLWLTLYMHFFDPQVAFQVCSGRYQSRSNARPTPAVSRDSLSSLPPPVPPPARRSSSRSRTASPLRSIATAGGADAAAVLGHDEAMQMSKQANLVLENPG